MTGYHGFNDVTERQQLTRSLQHGSRRAGKLSGTSGDTKRRRRLPTMEYLFLHGLTQHSKASWSFLSMTADSKDKPHPMAFADANWRPQDASIPSDSNARSIDLGETRSVCGHLVFLSNGPLIWKSHKEKRNSRSSCEAEIKATNECVKSVQWLRNVLNDLQLLHKNV